MKSATYFAPILLLTATSGVAARRRLEPADGLAIHGAGQDDPAFQNYTKMFNSTPPAIYMTYLQLSSLNSSNGRKWFSTLSTHLGNYTQFLVPQIGLSLTNGDTGTGKTGAYEDQVAAGAYDFAIEQMAIGLKSMDASVPAFIRVGYEFNG